MVNVLGLTPFADAFRLAMRIPNLLQNLLGEGSISASFVPVYAGLVERGEHERANELARRIATLLAAVVAVLVAVIVVGARPMVWITTLGQVSGDRFDLAVTLTRITTLGIGFLVLSAWCLGVLNANRQFFLPYVAPVAWNGAQLLVLGWLALTDAGATDDGLRSATRWLAVAVVVGSIAQLAVQIPAVLRLVSPLRPEWGENPDVRTVLRRFVPTLAGRGVVQLSSYLDLALASLAVAGAIAILAAVLPLYILAISVFGASVAVSELTEMSRSTQGPAAVAGRVRIGLRKTQLPAGVVTGVLLGGGGVIISTLYDYPARLLGRGTDGTAVADQVAAVIESGKVSVTTATLAAFALAIPAAMTSRVTQNALYAIGDVRGPARIAAIRLVVVAIVGSILVIQFDHLAAGIPSDADPAVANQITTTASASLGLAVQDGPFGTLSVGGFPHWPVWDTIGQREDPTLAHYGPVGLGLASAVAAWTEWALLRVRLRRRLGHHLHTGLETWVAIAGFATMVGTAAASALGMPPLIDAIAVGVVGLGTYIGALWFIGIRPS